MIRNNNSLIGVVLVVLLALVAADPVAASDPPSSSITVPAATGQSVSVTWSGTVPVGANPNSDCTQSAADQIDEHSLAVTVPEGAYSSLKAVFTFRMTWTPPTPNATANDLILTLVAPNGLGIASADSSGAAETLAVENLLPGTYKVLACGFANATAQPYSSTLTVQTQVPEPAVAAAPSQGLEFSAAVAADNQRDESEPLVEIDRAGNIYGCGPSGFSQAADYIQVSNDGGDQFHLIGVPPRGQASAGGGGDCALAFGLSPNSRGFYDWSYSGLGALSGFATSISPNNAHSIATAGFDLAGGVTNTGGVADRQWQTFVSETDVLLIYNIQQPRHTVVLRSTDKGLTFDATTAVRGNTSPLFPGQIRYDDAHDVVYFPWDDTGSLLGVGGDFVNLSVSRDKGRTWFACRIDFVRGEVPGFVSADHDSAGNIYVGYGDGVTYETYMKVLPFENIDKCNKPAATTAAPSLGDPGTGPRIRVDRGNVRTSLFPWVTAGKAPGYAAMMFLGTDTNGNPDLGTFKGSWYAYVNVTTNALSTDPANPPTFSQVRATTHPMHYDSICLGGLGCDISIPPGDRSMADFMALDYNAVTDKLTVIFNRTNKRPNEAVGRVASPMAATQIGGPTLSGGLLTPTRPVVRKSSDDPPGDALSDYSVLAPLIVPGDPPTRNEPASDFRSVSVGPEIDLHDGEAVRNGGFTVTMKVADLSTSALMDTLVKTKSQSLLWLFRFTNGHQDVAASARWNPVQGFTFGYNDYTTGTAPCESSGAATNDKCILYPGDTPIQGDANQATGTIRLSVPRHLLRGLTDETGNLQRPAETAASVGTRFFDATAWSLGNTVSPVQDVQSFLYPLDNTPAMDFLLPPDGGGGGGGAAGCKVTGGGAIAGAGTGKLTVDAHGGLQPFGNAAYRDDDTNFRSTSIATVACNGSSATVTGLGDDGDDEGRPFTVKVTDNGEPGRTDTFELSVNGKTKSGALTRGNLSVHG
jgi:hypothetical protein